MEKKEFSGTTPVKTVEEFLNAWNSHDLDALLATLDEKVVVVVPSLPEPLQGKQQVQTLWGTLFNKVSPDVKEEVLTIVSQGDTVACECIETAVYAPDSINKPYQIRLSAFFRVNESGLIEAMHSYWDTASMSRQLGKTSAELRGVLK